MLRAENSADVFFCMGTRPEIIKLAPLVIAFKNKGLRTRIVNSGQHQEFVTAPLYKFFGMQVDYDIPLNRDGEELGELNARLLSSYNKVFSHHHPVAVIVQGDTSSAWQAAQAAFFLHIPVAHIEAGLRTYDLSKPFPEELNRSLIARVARWHFAPTEKAAEALRHESVPGDIVVVGNTIVDATLWGMEQARNISPAVIPPQVQAVLESHKTIVVTAHRRENWGAGITSIAQAVRELILQHEELACIWVLHPNPAVASEVQTILADLPESAAHRLCLIPMQNYDVMLCMMHQAWLLLTDSGGIQEEAVTLGLPVLVARDETERPEVIECGVGRIVGTNAQRIKDVVVELLNKPELHTKMSQVISNPYGDGHTARRIVDYIANELTREERL